MHQADGHDFERRGLSWEEMRENDRVALRAQMALTPGERIEGAIRASRLATELAAAPLRRSDDRERTGPARG